MTKKQRLSFYKELLRIVCEDPSVDVGFCSYITNGMDEWYNLTKVKWIYAYDDAVFAKRLPELWSYNPFLEKPSYWFPKDKKGWQKRIDILVEIIEKLERSK